MDGDTWIIGEVDPIFPVKGRAAKPVPTATRRTVSTGASAPNRRSANSAVHTGRTLGNPAPRRPRGRPVEMYPAMALQVQDPDRDPAAASLSLLIPGGGQAIHRNLPAALCFLTGTAFGLAAAWALYTTHGAVTETLALLGAPHAMGAALVAAALLVAAACHIGSVVHALLQDGPARLRDPHPIMAGAASLLVPGWGQLLNGCPLRGGLFLAAGWLTAIGAAILTTPGLRLLAASGLTVPDWMNSPWGGATLIAIPLLAWIVSVYDAAATALAARR